MVAISSTLTLMAITSNANHVAYLLKKLVCSIVRVFVALQTVALRIMASGYSAWLDLAIERFSKVWGTKRSTGVIEHAFTAWIGSAY